MIDTEVTGDVAVAKRLRAVPSGVERSVRASIARLALALQVKVQSEKLTGQVLKFKTGTLRRSIAQVVETEPAAIVGIVSTNVGYGRAHEYGFQGSVSVGAHLRMIKQAFGKRLKNPAKFQIGAHSRSVNLPERSFLRSALSEMRGTVIAEIEAAASEGVAK